MNYFRRVAVLFALVFAFSHVVLAQDDVLIQAKRNLDGGDPQAAYSLLIPLQSERAGDPNYDFLLGSAALGIGKNTEAVFALERVLALRPDSAPARTLIARAYFNLKETETAKREFENVRKQEVPPEVALTIDRFLDAIARIEDAQRVTIRGYVEAGIGHDSNVNSATSDSQVAVPALAGQIFTLSPSSREQADTFISFGGGVGIRAPLTKSFSLFGGVAYSNKTNVEESDFSTYYYDANFGASYKTQRNTFTLVAQSNNFYVDNPQLYSDAYRNAYGGTAQWKYDFNARSQVSAFAQYTELRYPSQSVRNAKRYVGGLGFAHAFKAGGPIVYYGAYGGAEEEDNEPFPQFGHDLYGVRIGAQQFISEKYAVFLNLSGERREYHGQDPFFLTVREDDQYNASAGVYFVPRKSLRITPQVTWTQNTSNISINEFDRWVVSITLRQEI